MGKVLGIILLLAATLLFIGNRAYEFSEKPEITGSFSIRTSASPGQSNIIEIIEMYDDGGPGNPLHQDSESRGFHSLRIYYGEYGSLLEKYKEITDIRMPEIDYFDVVWTGEGQVAINVMHRNEAGEIFVFESYHFDFLTDTLTRQTP
ncbi:MAG TPA: hypothetical protein VLQ20_02925 [Planococcus sp. (in: firmicutes)]|nr:hypothetical protein [Planococcus sp. (in: firmicutes)]